MPNLQQLIAIALVAAGSVFFYFQEIQTSSQKAFGMRKMEVSESTSDYIKSQMEICYKISGANKCYQVVADLFMDQFSFETILSEFVETEEFPEVFSRCHEVTHYIGRKAYDAEQSMPELFSTDRFVCWGGFYHGVIEGYFTSKNLSLGSEPRLLADEIKKVCGDKKDYQSPRAFSECIHGIGHALMFISDMNLPKSLSWCDELADPQLRETCYGGIFMENSSSSTNSDHPGSYVKADDPLYPCNALDRQYLSICYQFQSSYFAQLTQWDWVKNAELCAQVPSPYNAGCYRVIGTNQVGAAYDLSVMHKTCQSMPDSVVEHECTVGVVFGLAGRYVGDPSWMIEFCGMVEDQFTDDCWIAVGLAASDWTAQKKQDEFVCVAPKPNLADLCRSAYNNNLR